jgi:hypothetical protein
VETLPVKRPEGHQPEITRLDADCYLEAISDGLTQDQAAAAVRYSRQGMEQWLKEHPELLADVERAKVECIRSRIKAQKAIGDTTDVKALNAAVKANACLLAAYDARFRKARDGEGAGGGGTTINVITAVQPQSVAGFFAAGGKAEPQMVRVLVEKYGKGILGEITEKTALKIAAESVSVNDQGALSSPAPAADSLVIDGSTSDNRDTVTLTDEATRSRKGNNLNQNGTQSRGAGGQATGDARTHTPIHPHNKSTNSEGPLDPVPVPGYVDTPELLNESVISDSPVRAEDSQ